MKKTTLALASLLFSGVALAQPATFVEIALVDGGENARNGSSDQFGLEVAGDAGLDDHWYLGGTLGHFSRDFSGDDTDNDYLNVHAGYLFPVEETTHVNLEAGLWLGDQDNPGTQEDTKPRAFEIKAGVSQDLSEKFGIFGTLSWVDGDLDTPQDSNLRNYVWSLGAAYAISESWSINLKIVNGVNGVNGQDQVLRFAGRFTF